MEQPKTGPEHRSASHEQRDRREHEQAMESVKCIIALLEEAREHNGLDYRITGGMSLYALMGKPVPLRRKNGTWRDVDCVILDGPQQVMDDIKGGIAALRRRGDCVVPTAFSCVQRAADMARRTTMLFPAEVRGEDGDIYLQYNALREKVPEELLREERTVLRLEDGTELPISTFSIGTTLHRYLTRIGTIKAKDYDKIKAFLRDVTSKGDYSYCGHAQYRFYHDFARAMREQYPHRTMALHLYTRLDKWIGSAISHRMIPERIVEFFGGE